MTDSKSVNQIYQGSFSDRGSKFYAFLHPVNNLDTYKTLIRRYKEENPNACHVCSAYRIYLNGWVDEYATDDGEPKGSSGLPILNVLKRNNLVNVAIYVVRIYGGVNLGIPGLINAYSVSSTNAVNDSSLIDWKPIERISIQYSYDLDKVVSAIVGSEQATIVKQEFKDEIFSEIEVEEGQKDRFIDLLTEKTSGRISILK